VGVRAHNYYGAGPLRKIEYRHAHRSKIKHQGENRDKYAAYIEGPNGKIFRGFKSTIPNLQSFIETLPEPEVQITSFTEAVKTRKKFALNEMNGYHSCTVVNMGVIALQLGRTLHFDPVTQRLIEDKDANRLIIKPMRVTWTI